MPKVITTRVCERCHQEKDAKLFRLKNKKFGKVCLDCRSKCVVCGNPIPNQTSLATKYCSNKCRRSVDNAQRAKKLAKMVLENPSYYKEQYILANVRGWKTYNPQKKHEYYLTVVKPKYHSDAKFRLKSIESVKAYYQRNRDDILDKKRNMSDEQREKYNSRIRNWRKSRWDNMTEEQRQAFKRHQNIINRRSRMRARLEKMRLDFAKIEQLKGQTDE